MTTTRKDITIDKNKGPDLPNVETLRRIDAACDQFELDWRMGREPRMESVLLLFPPDERALLLESLTSLHQELILKKVASIQTPEDFTEKLPPTPSAKTTELTGSLCLPGSRKDPAVEETFPRVIIKVIEGPHAGTEFSFMEHNTLLAGRSKNAHLRLKDDPRVSRHHFRLEIRPPQCYLMDLDSSNGTFVNAVRTQGTFLKEGDFVRIGRTKLQILIRIPVDANPASTLLGLPPEDSGAGRFEDSRKYETIANPGGTKSPASSPLAQTPAIAGYRLHSPIGTGEMGTVYRATRNSSGDPCALKVHSLMAHQDAKSTQSFLREVSILSQLNHPHLVRLLDAGTSGNFLYLSTEYVDTIPWEKLTTNWTPAKKIRVACGLMIQVLSALEHAHNNSFVHRDVKPGNILITRQGSKLVAKLADFGLAKQYTNAGMSEMTRNGDVIGSLPYMAPEQFVNSRAANPPCDLYSAGATLYWLLTGTQPVSFSDSPCKFLAILEKPHTPLQSVLPDAGPQLIKVIDRSLEKDPTKRFFSASEMRAALRKCLSEIGR